MKRGESLLREIYKDRVLIVPYIKSGFKLAKKICEMTRNEDWKRLEGMILMHHGIFTFSDDAQTSYERMIYLVSLAEDYLQNKVHWIMLRRKQEKRICSNYPEFVAMFPV